MLQKGLTRLYRIVLNVAGISSHFVILSLALWVRNLEQDAGHITPLCSMMSGPHWDAANGSGRLDPSSFSCVPRPLHVVFLCGFSSTEVWRPQTLRVNVQEATVETLGLLLTWHQKSQDNTFAFYWPSTYYGQPRFEGRQTRLHLSVGGIANNLQPSLIYQSRGLA